MFEITRCDSRTAIDTCKEAKSPAEHGRPSLEVRRCGDGHPPVTERERVIRLNGIGGVRFKNPDRTFDPGFSLRTFVILSEAKLQRSGQSPRGQAFNLGSFLPQRWNDSQRCFAWLNMTIQPGVRVSR